MLRSPMRALPCLALLLAFPSLASLSGAEKAPPAPTKPGTGASEPAPRGLEVSVGLVGRLGASVGHVLIVPVAYAFPSIALEGGIRVALWKNGYFAGIASLSLGVDDNGGPLGSYRGRLSLGVRWLDLGWLALSSEAHAGVASFAFVPIPRWGLGHSLVVTPVNLGGLAWDIGLDVDTDLLVIAPTLGATVGTGLRFISGRWCLIFEVEAGAEAMIAVFANTLGGAVSARVTSGWTF